MAYRLATAVVPSLRTPAQHLLRPWGLVAAERLRAQARPALWPTLEALEVDDETRGWFARARAEGSRFALPEDVIFSSPLLPARVSVDRDLGFDLEQHDDLATLRDVLSGDWEGYGPGHPGHDLAGELIDAGYLVPARRAPLAHYARPGIHRLQHASLLFRSESAAVITDPVNFVGPQESGWSRPDALPRIDAVLISHSHNDHFSLLSLAQFPRDTMIVVPQVRSPSILCGDMAGQLRAAGFTHVVEAAWFSTLTVKDIRVHVYPFYGEQPWIGFPAPVDELRNVGNTFVIELLDRKAYVLIDSGPEAGVATAALHERVRAEHGHIDFVVSNLREFKWRPEQIDGSGAFLFCFPHHELERPDRWPYERLITYGPRGMRELLELLRPSHFFPYAHWFDAVETRGHDVSESRATEHRLVQAIVDAGDAELATRVENWAIGDHLGWSRSGIRVSSPLREAARAVAP